MNEASIGKPNNPIPIWTSTEIVGRDEGGGVVSHVNPATSWPACAANHLFDVPVSILMTGMPERNFTGIV